MSMGAFPSFTREKNEHACDNIAGLFPCLAPFSPSKCVGDRFGREPAQLGQTGYPAVLFSINLLLNTAQLIHTQTHEQIYTSISLHYLGKNQDGQFTKL